MRLALVTLVAAAVIATAWSGCSKRQIVPISLAGAGAALMTSGFVYRATLPEEDSTELLGRSPQQKAATSVLIFGGAALILTGVIWSVTTPLCDSDSHCFGSDTCDEKTETCIAPGPAPAEPESTALIFETETSRLTTFQPGRFALDLGPATR
jgi:hypothetical protein